MNVLKRLNLLFGLFLVCTPSLSSAYQILPNPNPAGSTIYLYTPDDIDTAENLIDFVNYGSITLGYDNTLNNFAKLDNFGDISGGGNGHLNNSGTLNIASGGVLQISLLSNSSSGTVNNNGEMWLFSRSTNAGAINNSNFFIVFEGSLHNTGTVTNDNLLSIHHAFLNNTGTVQNNGHIDNDAAVHNTGTITGSGTYSQIYDVSATINDGVLTQSTIHIYDGLLGGTGIINGNVIVDSGMADTAIIAPGDPVQPFIGGDPIGDPTGTFTINGNLSSAGSLDFEMGGINAGEFDVLHITGNADFTGGNLKFDFIDGFKPATGDSFDFLAAHSISGWNTLDITLNGLAPGQGGHFVRLENGDIALFITEMPEPAINAMLIAGLGFLGFKVRQRTFSAVRIDTV